MRQYLDILRKALEEGDDRADRTGIGTRAVFGEMMRFDLSRGFPAVTTKRLAFRSVVAELLWFLAGSSDVNDLHALGVHIWDGNAFADYWRSRARFPGDAGRNYGQQWRDWIAPDGRHIDQLRDSVRDLLSKGNKKILLNLADVNYIDSSGIGELVSAFTTTKNQGGELKLLKLTKKVNDLLQITKLYTVFDVKDDEAAAVKSFK